MILWRLLRFLVLMAAGENVVVSSGKVGLRSSGKMGVMDSSNECDECCGLTLIDCLKCIGQASEWWQIDVGGSLLGSPGGCTDVECQESVGVYICQIAESGPECVGVVSEIDGAHCKGQTNILFGFLAGGPPSHLQTNTDWDSSFTGNIRHRKTQSTWDCEVSHSLPHDFDLDINCKSDGMTVDVSPVPAP